MSLYHRLKESFYLFGEKLVSFGDKLFYTYFKRSSSSGQYFAQKAGMFIGNVGWVFRDIFRLSVYKARGQDWAIIYVGNGKERQEIEHLFFPDQNAEWQEDSPVHIWSLGRKIKEWLAEGNNFVITEISRTLPSFSQTKYNFTLPHWVSQVIKLPQKVETLLEGPNLASKRKQINKLIREGYGFKLSKDPEDLTYFYNEIYAPNIQRSFGFRAHIMTRQDLYNWFAMGGLRFVLEQGNPVAASIYVKTGDSYLIVMSGVLEIAIKKNVKSLLHWADLTCASELGATEVDFGGSRPWVSDGVFEYKRRWDAYVKEVIYEPIHSNWHFYANELTAQQLDFINQAGFITKYKGRFFNAFLFQDESVFHSEQLEQMVNSAHEAGLQGVLAFTPNMKRVFRSF